MMNHGLEGPIPAVQWAAPTEKTTTTGNTLHQYIMVFNVFSISRCSRRHKVSLYRTVCLYLAVLEQQDCAVVKKLQGIALFPLSLVALVEGSVRLVSLVILLVLDLLLKFLRNPRALP